MAISTAPDISGSGRVDKLTRLVLIALARAVVATGGAGQVETRHVSDTWKGGSLSLFLSLRRRIKKKKRREKSRHDAREVDSVHPQPKQLAGQLEAFSAEFESKLSDLTELVRQSSRKGFSAGGSAEGSATNEVLAAKQPLAAREAQWKVLRNRILWAMRGVPNPDMGSTEGELQNVTNYGRSGAGHIGKCSHAFYFWGYAGLSRSCSGRLY